MFIQINEIYVYSAIYIFLFTTLIYVSFYRQKHWILLCFYIFNLFCMHIFIVQHIHLDFRSVCYIQIDIIIITSYQYCFHRFIFIYYLLHYFCCWAIFQKTIYLSVCLFIKVCFLTCSAHKTAQVLRSWNALIVHGAIVCLTVDNIVYVKGLTMTNLKEFLMVLLCERFCNLQLSILLNDTSLDLVYGFPKVLNKRASVRYLSGRQVARYTDCTMPSLPISCQLGWIHNVQPCSVFKFNDILVPGLSRSTHLSFPCIRRFSMRPFECVR